MYLTADVIKGFSSSLLQKTFDSPVQSPACHYEWWELFCQPSPMVAIAAPRMHAKTTALTHTYTLAAVLFREREYVCGFRYNLPGCSVSGRHQKRTLGE